MEIEKHLFDSAYELRNIAKEVVRKEAEGLEESQYWGLRLRLIADKISSQPGNAANREITVINEI